MGCVVLFFQSCSSLVLLGYFFFFLYNTKYQIFNTYKKAYGDFFWDYIKSIKLGRTDIIPIVSFLIHEHEFFLGPLWLLWSVFYSLLEAVAVHFVRFIPKYLFCVLLWRFFFKSKSRILISTIKSNWLLYIYSVSWKNFILVY